MHYISTTIPGSRYETVNKTRQKLCLAASATPKARKKIHLYVAYFKKKVLKYQPSKLSK
jgi:hypothetical protein